MQFAWRPLALLRAPLRPFHPLRAPFAFRLNSTLNNTLRVPQRRVKPQSTVDLVSFKAKKLTPDNLAPLAEAPELYARIHIHNWNMLVTEGDVIKLPVHMKDVNVGDTLRFDQCSEIGSRTHTLSGERIDPKAFEIKGVVVEKTRVKRQVTEKTRRRRRHVRHVVSQNCLTVIRISDLRVHV